MEIKKSPKADERGKSLSILMGFVVGLAVSCSWSFEWSTCDVMVVQASEGV